MENFKNNDSVNREVNTNEQVPINTMEDLKLNLLSIKNTIAEMNANKDSVLKKDYAEAKIREKELRIEIKKLECKQYCSKLRSEIIKLNNDIANDKKRELEKIIKSNNIDMDVLINAAKNILASA